MFVVDFYCYLMNCFEEWQGFDIVYGIVDFYQYDVMVFVVCQYVFFDSVGDVWDNLNGCVQVVVMVFFVQYVGVDMVGGEVIVVCYFGVDKMFIVVQVQIGFCVVFSNEYFFMLDWVYGVWIDVDIWIQFYDGYVEIMGFKNGCQGGCGNVFIQRGYDFVGYKNIVCCYVEFEKLG